jgi:hypothetical protein
MSLSEVVLEIADDMEQRSGLSCMGPVAQQELVHFAKQLRRVVKASEQLFPIQPVVDRRIVDETMRMEEVRRKQLIKNAEIEEHFAGGMVQIEGGRADGVMVPIDDKIPDQAKIMLEGQVYMFSHKDRKFHYSEEETGKLQKS